MYKTNRIGPSTDPCGTPQISSMTDDLTDPRRILIPTGQIRVEPPVGGIMDAERRLQALEQY